MEIRNKSRKTLEFKPHWENSLGFKLPVFFVSVRHPDISTQGKSEIESGKIQKCRPFGGGARPLILDDWGCILQR